MTVKQEYDKVEQAVDRVGTHLVHLKYTAAVIAIILLIDLWLIV